MIGSCDVVMECRDMGQLVLDLMPGDSQQATGEFFGLDAR